MKIVVTLLVLDKVKELPELVTFILHILVTLILHVTVFLEDPELGKDNNLAEQAIRPYWNE